jgi:hypothetical protein
MAGKIVAALLALLSAMTNPALAADPLRGLVPLLEVFSTTSDSPGYDVVGIRCAGLLYAQDTWRQNHGGMGPGQKLLASAATGLELATQHRIGLGHDLTQATLSVEADFRRVYELYLARFATNDATGHPWSNDPLLRGDQSYCKGVLR